jgi:regulatory subunit for Cdc7p protein kinase
MSSRGPLVARPPPHQSPSTHGRIIRSVSSLPKRPRSPEPTADPRTKRAKSTSQGATPNRAAAAIDARHPDRDERRAEREAQREEFRMKYRKAFPGWVFHFDADVPAGSALDRLQADIESLGGVRCSPLSYASVCSSYT